VNRRVLLIVLGISLTLACACGGLLVAQSVRASGERDRNKATQTAQAAGFLDPLKALCTGQSSGVAGAGTYTAGPGVHKMVAFRTLNANNYTRDTRIGTGEWEAKSLDEAQLVACAEESSVTIESCPYRSQTTGTTSTLNRYQNQVKLRLVAAKTGQVVGTTTLKGTEPRACQQQETFASGATTASVSGDPVTPAAIQAWLKTYVAP
jgi:hypothetical protein